jgi:hypothetical protein
MKFILSVIVVCLVLITAKLYVPDVTAEAQMGKYRIEKIIENCTVFGDVDVSGDVGYLSYGNISC